MNTDLLTAHETAIRAAIVQGRYADAQSRLDEYCRDVAVMWELRPAPGAAELPARVSRLIEWARQMTLSGQAQLTAQLRQLDSLRRYRPVRPAASIQTWGLEA